MIGRQYQGASADEVAVRRDDELLFLLGRRLATPRAADPATALLRALTDDVDQELAAPVVAEDDAPSLPRRHGARGTVIGVVVAATLSVSGVAAAVTGDLLSPYRAVLSLGQDEDPAAPRRGAAPDPATIRRESTTPGQNGGLVAAPDVLLGRVALGDAQVSGRGASAPRSSAAGKPAKEDQSSGLPDSAVGRPENPGTAADQGKAGDRSKEAKAAKAAKEAKAAKDAKDAKQATDADTAGTPVGTSGGAAGSQRGRNTVAPEEKAQGSKP